MQGREKLHIEDSETKRLDKIFNEMEEDSFYKKQREGTVFDKQGGDHSSTSNLQKERGTIMQKEFSNLQIDKQ